MARLELAGRAVLITGAAQGIGLDVARRLAARGARLALIDANGEALEQRAEELGAVALPGDVADRGAMEAAVAQAVERLGGLDVVVANAGVAGPRSSLRLLEDGELERVIAVNLLGVWNTVRPALPHVVARRGHVLVVASLYAAANGMLAGPYAISKAGVEQMGRALRAELAVHETTAGVAYFGFIDTEMVRVAFQDPAAAQARQALPAWVTRPLPVGRAGAAVVRGIERRSPRVTAPRWIPAVLASRGVLALLDSRLGHDRRTREAVRIAERGREP